MGTNELIELDEIELFELLGDAWLAHFGEPWFASPDKSHPNYLRSSSYIGMCEFAAVAPFLIEDLRHSRDGDFVAVVSATVKLSGTWKMPVEAVAALAIRQRLVPSNILEFRQK